MADTRGYTVLSRAAVNGIDVIKLKSTKTGILVYMAQSGGPIVNGFVCLATEAHDHDGLPHTLEHLVFMGSELYPYKGVLDLLANRCLAQGTNAWTDVDHTCYTVDTAGSRGFLNLLPIYLDHILYPTLTDEAYCTEVHHINGDGEDAGVVYCEMQARENTPEDMTHFSLLQHMYPGHCGYKSETGGRLENLRTSTSNAKVCSYHSQYYRPDNLAIIVVGQVSPEELFQSIAKFEDKVKGKGPLPSMERPWQSPVPPFQESVVEEINFPTEDESVGLVRIGWRGPKAQDRYKMSAVESMIQYLCDTSVAPLQRELVEVPEPYCSTVKSLMFENAESCVGFTFKGVPTAKLDGLEKKVLAVLEDIGSGSKGVDMARMKTILRRSVLKNLESLEDHPDYYFAFNIIGDFLFGDHPDQFPVYLDSIPRLQRLLEEPESFWVELIESVFIKSPHIFIAGRPSLELSKKMTEEEKHRISQQCKALGEEGLKDKEKILEEALLANEREPPENFSSDIPVPDASSINHHKVTVYRTDTLSEELRRTPEYSILPVDKFPFPLQLNQIQSSFAEIEVVLDSAVVPVELRQFLPLLTHLMFESPVKRDGVVISYEQVVQQLSEDTISTSAGLGINPGVHSCGKFPQVVWICIKVESSKYAKGVQWLREVLYQVLFQKERIIVAANKMLNTASEAKRKGRNIVKAMGHKVNFSKDCNQNISSMYTQSNFLKDLLSKVSDQSQSEEVVTTLGKVRDLLVDPSNLRVYINTNIKKVADNNDAMLPWQPLIKQAKHSVKSLVPIVRTASFLDRTVWGKSYIAGVGGVDSSYLSLVTPAISDYGDSDYPALLVFMEYLCALEGPLWRQIRGMGLSYHYSMWCKIEEGLLYFILFRSAQVAQAFKEAKKILDGFLSGETPFEPLLLEAAVSSTIFQLVEREKTVSDVGQEAVLSNLRSTSYAYNRELLTAVSKVTVDQIKTVGQKYFRKLFQPQFASCTVCCTPNKEQEVKEMLARLDWEVTVVEDLEKMFEC